jgi:hypothetical protein
MPFQAFPAGRSGYTEKFQRQSLLPSPTGVHRLSTLLAGIAGPTVLAPTARSSAAYRSTVVAAPTWGSALAG